MFILLVPVIVILLALVAVVCLLRKRWIAALLLFLVASFINVETQSIPVRLRVGRIGQHGDLRVMTWNVCHNVATDDSLQRDADMAEVVERQHPDILVLQEHDLAGGTGLDRQLREMYPYCGGYMSELGTRNACFYSKLPIVSFQRLSVESIPEAFFADVAVQSDTLRIVGCHLTSNGISLVEKMDTTFWGKVKEGYRSIRSCYPVRERQALALRKCVSGSPHPVIVAGGLNDLSGSNTLKLLRDRTHGDAWWSASLGMGVTYWHYAVRLDHILYPYDDMEVIRVRTPRCHLSAHNPVCVELKMGDD